jgi:hypothetical protein
MLEELLTREVGRFPRLKLQYGEIVHPESLDHLAVAAAGSVAPCKTSSAPRRPEVSRPLNGNSLSPGKGGGFVVLRAKGYAFAIESGQGLAPLLRLIQ